MRKEEKHFLDTSILIPLICGSKRYKEYLKEKIENKSQYLSSYVKMEARRNLIDNLIDFYMLLECPSTSDLSDALRIWTNRFSKRQVSVALFFTASLQGNQKAYSDKNEALRRLALYICRIDMFIRNKFKDPNNDLAHCPKPEILLQIEDFGDIEIITKRLKDFTESFNDSQNCKKCRIKDTLKNRFKKELKLFVENSEIDKIKASSIKANKNGYLKICEEIKTIKEEISCKKCASLGDAVITLTALRDMQLEHTDDSFEYLCPLVNQPHRKHPSESSLPA
jgi:hypothetical protein